jgi:hypothetical protein
MSSAEEEEGATSETLPAGVTGSSFTSVAASCLTF